MLHNLVLLLTMFNLIKCTHSHFNSTSPKVSLYFKGVLIKNNSYVLYANMNQGHGRVHCVTSKVDCCNFASNIIGDWYLPNGERIRGGYEYPSGINFFARSRGLQNIGLYRQGHPTQRGRFFCELPDFDGTNHTLFVNIVDQIPVILSEPQPCSSFAGDSVQFTISVAFAVNSQTLFQWQKNGIDIIEESGHYEGTTSPNLTLFNVQDEDEGEYQCVVDKYLLSRIAELSVVQFPVKVNQDTRILNLTSGDNIDILMHTWNSSTTNIQLFYWQKDGANITSGDNYKGTNTDILTILNAQQSHEGSYTLVCYILESQNITSESFYIHVVNVTLTVEPSAKPAFGIYFALACEIRGVEQLNPNISFQWSINDNLLLNNTNPRLIFNDLTDDNSGDYSCAMKISSNYLAYEQTSKKSKKFQLRIAPKPIVTLGGRIINNNDFVYYDEIGEQGEGNALTCFVNNPSTYTLGNESIINWFFPNGNIIPSGIALQKTNINVFTRVARDGQLLLYRADRSRVSLSGQYYCSIYFEGKSGTLLYVNIGSRPSLSLRGISIHNNSLINIDDIGGNNDQEALLCHTDNENCCTSESSDDNGALGGWYHTSRGIAFLVDELLDSERWNSSSFFMTGGQSLIRLFYKGLPLERGEFCCRIPDRSGLNRTQCVFIEDHSSPSYSLLLEAYTVSVDVHYTKHSLRDKQGYIYNLHCVVRGINYNFTQAFSWYKNKILIHGEKASTLHLESVSFTDAGNYSCEVVIRANPLQHGTIITSLSKTINVPSVTFQIRLNNIQNCLQWTSSDAIAQRVQDITSMIVSLLVQQCDCNFTRTHIKNAGFKCFLGSENHVTFRGELWETTNQSSQQLIEILKAVIERAQYWLIRGQYLRINHSCNLIITDIHAPECFTNTEDTTTYPLQYSTVHLTASNIGYIIWAVISTSMFLFFASVIGLVIFTRRKCFKQKTKIGVEENVAYYCPSTDTVKAELQCQVLDESAADYEEIEPITTIDAKGSAMSSKLH